MKLRRRGGGGGIKGGRKGKRGEGGILVVIK